MTDQTYTPTNALAVAAAWLGVLAVVGATIGLIALDSAGRFVIAWILSAVPGILAIIFGIIGVGTAGRIGGRRRAPAVWGIVLGVAAIPVGVFVRFLLAAIVGI